jgi:fructokinase
MYNLIGLGEILWDLLPKGRQLGGAPANFAFHANNLGATGKIISRVGHDPNGADIIVRLNDLRLGTELIQIDPGVATGTVSVEVLSDGQPRYVIHEHVAWDRIAAKKEACAAAAKADAICFGTLAQRSEKSRDSIHELLACSRREALRILDVNLRQNFYSAEVLDRSLRAANVLKVNDGELPIIAELLSIEGTVKEQLGALAERYELRLVAYTRGAQGSLLFSAGKWAEHPGFATEVADTIGAGDSFTAAMAVGFLSGWDLETINDRANRVASFVASQPGGTPTLPPEIRGLFKSK